MRVSLRAATGSPLLTAEARTLARPACVGRVAFSE